jgi:hypothetical protein
MMFPVGVAWGTDVYGPPTTLQTSYVYRVTAAEDGTVVTVDLGAGNTETIQLDHGAIQELDFPGTNFTGAHFSSNQPILVMHYGAGQPGGGNTGAEPFAVQLVPVADASTSFSFYAPPAPTSLWYGATTYTNSALVVAPNAAVGSVQLNGSAMPASSFSALPGGAYQYAQVSVPDGVNVVTSTQPVTVYTLGTSIWTECWSTCISTNVATYAAPARF